MRRVVIVEETEVADDAKHVIIGGQRLSRSRRKTSFNAVDAAVAIHIVLRIETAHAHGHAVGIVHHGHIGVSHEQAFETLHHMER